MKAIFLFAPLLLYVSCFGQPESSPMEKDTLFARLEKIDLEHFLDKPTDSVLRVLPAPFQYLIEPTERPLFSHMVTVRFSNHPYLFVKLFYNGFQRTNPNAFFRRRQLRNLRRETVEAVEIHTAAACLNGCDR